MIIYNKNIHVIYLQLTVELLHTVLLRTDSQNAKIGPVSWPVFGQHSRSDSHGIWLLLGNIPTFKALHKQSFV